MLTMQQSSPKKEQVSTVSHYLPHNIIKYDFYHMKDFQKYAILNSIRIIRWEMIRRLKEVGTVQESRWNTVCAWSLNTFYHGIYKIKVRFL